MSVVLAADRPGKGAAEAPFFLLSFWMLRWLGKSWQNRDFPG